MKKFRFTTFDMIKQISNNSDNVIKLNEKQINEVQKYSLEMADDIIDICENNNISYHLTGGTALGAIRHNGFIPWDDDIDIDVERKDYDKLITLIKDKYSNKYYIHNPFNNDGHSIVATQIKLKNTILRGITERNSEQCGITIDIMIIDNTYNNKILRNIHGFVSLGLGYIASCRKFAEFSKEYLKIAEGNVEAIKIFKKKIFIGKLFSFISLRNWNILYYKWNGLCKNNNSKYVTVPTGRKKYFGEIYKRNEFCEYVRYDFEKRKWKIPKEYDKYLKHMYGDYMKLPDENHREQHVVLEYKINKD